MPGSECACVVWTGIVSLPQLLWWGCAFPSSQASQPPHPVQSGERTLTLNPRPDSSKQTDGTLLDLLALLDALLSLTLGGPAVL